MQQTYVKDQWETYRTGAELGKLTRESRTRIRVAFFHGFGAFVNLLVNSVPSWDDLPEAVRKAAEEFEEIPMKKVRDQRDDMETEKGFYYITAGMRIAHVGYNSKGDQVHRRYDNDRQRWYDVSVINKSEVIQRRRTMIPHDQVDKILTENEIEKPYQL